MYQFEEATRQLFEAAEKGNKDSLDFDNAVGEVTISNITYQVQLKLTPNKKTWIKENELRCSEVIKIHD